MITSFCKAAFSLNNIVILSGIHFGLITVPWRLYAPSVLPALCERHNGIRVTLLKVSKFQKTKLCQALSASPIIVLPTPVIKQPIQSIPLVDNFSCHIFH